MDPSGQSGIRLREALVRGDVAGALAEVPALDEAHRIELLLGAALRDDRDEGVDRYLGGDWEGLCIFLAGEGRHAADLRAASLVAARRAPDRWQPNGRDWTGELDMETAAAALLAGFGGLSLLDALRDRPRWTPVSAYYRLGTIHALGCRPLMTLAG